MPLTYNWDDAPRVDPFRCDDPGEIASMAADERSLVSLEESRAVWAYRMTRDEYLAAQARADDAWNRWFAKRTQGIATNGAQAARLDNEANRLSADLAGAQLKLYRFDLDPRDVDRKDGIDRLISY